VISPTCHTCGGIHAGPCPGPGGSSSGSGEGTTQLATQDPSVATADPGDPAAAPRPPAGVELRPRSVAASGPAQDNDYLVGEVIGQGGMGLVRRGLQTSLGRPVALKTLRLERTATPAAWSRFLTEAAVTAHLDHPGIIPVYDLGVDGEGRPFYVMPLIDGQPWGRSIGTVPLAFDLEVLLAVADAIAYAHSKGVVHRDLKPDNVMLGQFGQVLVVDWGLAVALAPGVPAPAPGAGGARAGTPAWMAPESARGDWRRLGRATDVYQLGALLHRILTGVPPHAGADARAQLAEAAANRIQGRAEGPLAALAVRAMADDPADRFADAAQFRTALAEWQDHHESIALARAAGEQLERAQAAAGYTAAAHACSGAARGFAAAMRLWPGNAVAEVSLAAARLAWARLALAEGDLDLAESLLDRRHDGHEAMIARVRQARREAQLHQRRNRLLRRGLVAAAGLLAVVAAGWGALRWDQQRRTDQAEEARLADRQRTLDSLLAAQHTAAAQAGRARRRAAASAPFAAGIDLVIRGQLPAQAAALLRQALAADPDFPEAQRALGDALGQAGDPLAAAEAYLAADRLSRDLLGRPYLEALVAAGMALDEAGEYQRSQAAFAQAAAQGGDHPLALVAQSEQAMYRLRLLEAERLTASALAQGGHLWEVHSARMSCLQRLGQTGLRDPLASRAEAVVHARRACAMAPARQPHRLALAQLLLQANDKALRAEGEAIFAAVEREHARNPMVAAYQVMDRLRCGELDQASALIERARELGAPPVLLQYLRQAVLGGRGDPAGALAVLATMPDRDSADLAGIRLDHEARLTPPPPGFAARAQRWADDHPDSSDGPAILAVAATTRKDHAEAARVLDAGLVRFPHSLDLALLRAQTALAQGDAATAGDIAARLIVKAPLAWPTRLLELECLLRLGRHEHLLQRADDLVADFPEPRAAITRDSVRRLVSQREGR
ncbi:MAG: protein kinase, partial [Planctomycetes bacterium]|nr:protein kinase [Planctomycetota bacterium]